MPRPELSVLLVEDNHSEGRRIVGLLAASVRCSVRVTHVASLTAASESLAQQPVDVILLDWFLPDHYGVASLNALQAVAPRTPVLMLTGWDDDDSAIDALRAGAQDVIVKERLTTTVLERTIRYAVERKRTESALRQTEEMYRSLIESLPINVFRKDIQGRFVFANQRFCDVMHKRLDELVGQTDFAFFPPLLAEKYQQDDLKVIHNKRVVEEIEEHAMPDGHRLHVQVMKAPVTDLEGKIVGTQSMFWDVTQRIDAEEALQRSNSRFRKLFDANIIGIMLADLSGAILEANDALLSLIGYTRDDMLTGRLRWDRITPAEYVHLDIHAVESLRTTGVCPAWEKEYYHKDGSRVPVMVGVSMLDDSFNECICFVLDMTQQRRIQGQLRRAKEEADAANEAKSLFLANMSHEIRTPMNAIIGLTELVLDSPLTAQQRDNLTAVADSAESLLSLINHILDFSKIEAGKLELDDVEFSLRTMIAGAMKTLALSAHRKGLELICDIRRDVPDRLLGDAVRLRQIVMNLLGNAIKFTDSGEVALRINVTSCEDNSLELRLDVQDTGIGIPADRQAAIFEAFEQVHTSINRKYGGTGLGLSITAKLAQLMGGQVWLQSELGHGSTFFVTCRFKIPTGSTLPNVPSPLSGLKVLIVDDNAASRQQLFDQFTLWQTTPMAVSSAKGAIALLEQVAGLDDAFAFTIIDAQMPGVDGFELASTIKSGLAERAGQLLMMLSSADRTHELTRCEQLKLDATISKPVNESELLDTLMSLRLGTAGVDAPTLPDRPSPVARITLKVLLAEDSLYNQKLAIALLTKRGHQVTVANNGREAVDLVFRQPFDRVLMDVQMPEMDGLEATRVIREREARFGIHRPIIAMTAQALTGDRERCLAAGMDEYLTKPIRSDQMFEVLEADFPNAVFPKEEIHKKPPRARTQQSRPPDTKHCHEPVLPSEPIQHLPTEQAAVATKVKTEPYPVTSSSGNIPATSYVNWKQALSAVGGDHKLLREVVAACLEDFPRWFNSLDTGVSQKDSSVLRRAAHSIRGACRTFGIDKLVPASQDLEMLAAAGNLPAAGQLLETLRPELHLCVAELQQFLSQP